MLKQKRDDGFTLIELMIVIAVIGILAVVLIPKIGNVKTAAKETGVQSNFQSVIATLQAGQSTFAGKTDDGASAATGDLIYDYLVTTVGYGTPLTTATNNTISNPFTGVIGVGAADKDKTPAIIIVGTVPTWDDTYKGAIVLVPDITNGTGSIQVYGCGLNGSPLPSLSTTLNF